MPGQAASKQIEKSLELNVEKIVAGELTEKAAELESKIVIVTRKLRAGWIELAGHLYEFFRIDGWAQLGYGSFREWAADPRFDLRSQSELYRLLEAYREFVVLRGVAPAVVGRVHWTKLQLTLPAVRRKQVDPARAIADAETLTTGDLRERYSKHTALHGEDIDDKPIEPDDWVWEPCPHCGGGHKCTAVSQ